MLLSPFVDPGTVDNVAYNHFTMLRSIEDLFGLSHLGFAGMPGLRTLGADAFTCYRARTPRSRHGRLPRGAEIKLAVIGQGTARHPMIEVELWHAGRVTVAVSRRTRRGRARRPVLALRRLGSRHRLSACRLLRVGLPHQHGTVVLSARAFGATESRTISY